MLESKVLTANEMQAFYKDFYKRSREIKFDYKSVPQNVIPLIPYAELWGHTDDGIRLSQGLRASDEVKKNLEFVIDKYQDELDAWLAGPEVSASNPSEAYLAFSAMRMASDFMPK